MEKDNEIISNFGSNSIIWVFDINSCFNKGINRETDSFSRVKKNNKIIFKFSDMTTKYKKRNINRYITNICFINIDYGNNIIGTYY